MPEPPSTLQSAGPAHNSVVSASLEARGDYLLLSIAFKRPASKPPKSVVVLADVSPSMEGWKIHYEKSLLLALSSVLESLGAQLRLYAFCSRVKGPLEPGGSAWVELLDALKTCAGTNIGEAIKAACILGASGEPVLLVSDGVPTVGARSPGRLKRLVDRECAGRARLVYASIRKGGEGEDVIRALLDSHVLEGVAYSASRDAARDTAALSLLLGLFEKVPTRMEVGLPLWVAPACSNARIESAGGGWYGIDLLDPFLQGRRVHVLLASSAEGYRERLMVPAIITYLEKGVAGITRSEDTVFLEVELGGAIPRRVEVMTT